MPSTGSRDAAGPRLSRRRDRARKRRGNIQGRFLDFRETFIDDGDVDMLKALRVYKEIGFDGMLMPDHVPTIDGDPRGAQAFAYTFGYIKALIAAVSAEA